MKIAFICDWLTGMRGGERCLEAMCELYPNANIFTLVHFPGTVSEIIESHNIYTSYIQRLPGDTKTFRRYLPVFGNAIRKFNLSKYDFILSFSHCVAKNVKVPKGIPHICYCHTPMRYAWHMRNEYLNSYKGLKKLAAEIMLDYLKNHDRKAAAGVTHFITNSKNVQKHIKTAYSRDSIVIYPPVECNRFAISQVNDGYYLIVSALVPYKKIDLAVKAFSNTNRRLLVIGKGLELKNLKAMASDNITFIENASDKEVTEYMKKCIALIFPGEEDFGIVPLEAQACGKGVIAFGKGGALETVRCCEQENEPSGLYFHEQSGKALIQAVEKFERIRVKIIAENCRKNALRFDRAIYKKKMYNFIERFI